MEPASSFPIIAHCESAVEVYKIHTALNKLSWYYYYFYYYYYYCEGDAPADLPRIARPLPWSCSYSCFCSRCRLVDLNLWRHVGLV